MHEIPVTEARAEFSELISRVAYGGEPAVITRHGKPLVALVPAAMLAELTARFDGPEQSDAPATVLDITARNDDAGTHYPVAARREGPTSR